MSAPVLGWILIAGSLPELPAARASGILLVRPVRATLWAITLFGEASSVATLIGLAVTLVGVEFATR